MVKRLDQIFVKAKMTNKQLAAMHIKCSTLLITKEMQTKTTIKMLLHTNQDVYNFFKKENKFRQKCGAIRILIHSCGGGVQNGAASLENSSVSPQEIKHDVSTWLSTSTRNILQRIENRNSNRYLHTAAYATVFILAKRQK